MSTRRSKKTRRNKSKKEVSNEKHIRDNGAFFNKGKRYKSGSFISRKMQRRISYRSAYEYTFYSYLESSDDVIKYITEPVKIQYIDIDGLIKYYIPDCLVLYSDGRMELCEVKPSEMLKAMNVKLKARAAIKYIKETGTNMIYRFVTEKDLFKMSKDYKTVLERLK